MDGDVAAASGGGALRVGLAVIELDRRGDVVGEAVAAVTEEGGIVIGHREERPSPYVAVGRGGAVDAAAAVEIAEVEGHRVGVGADELDAAQDVRAAGVVPAGLAVMRPPLVCRALPERAWAP